MKMMDGREMAKKMAKERMKMHKMGSMEDGEPRYHDEGSELEGEIRDRGDNIGEMNRIMEAMHNKDPEMMHKHMKRYMMRFMKEEKGSMDSDRDSQEKYGYQKKMG